MIDTNDPRLLSAVLANFDPNDAPVPEVGGSGGGGGDVSEAEQAAVLRSRQRIVERIAQLTSRPVAAPSGATDEIETAPVDSETPPSDFGDRPAVAPLATSASPAAQTAAPETTHCQHYEACNSSTCPACEPRWRGQAGRAMLDYLHDAPEEFLTLFAALSEQNKEETYAAIASFLGKDAAAVKVFIHRNQVRARHFGLIS